MAQKKRHWSDEENAFLRLHITDMTVPELAKALGRTVNAINARKKLLGLTHVENAPRAHYEPQSPGRSWTSEQETYLEENWGKRSIPAIARKLGRSVEAVKIRASRLGLGPSLMAGDYVTFNQLIQAFQGKSSAASYQIESWIKKRGFPIHTRIVQDCSFRVVYLDEFWAWAEQHRSFLDFSRMEPLALGKEPDWVDQQRKIDYVSFANQRKDPWTPEEDQRLAHLLKQHKYTWTEISRELHRSAGAIQRRACDLGLKERPVRASPHNPWSDEDLQLMAEMIRQGCSYAMIGEACGGRSEKAVRGICWQKYQTEDMDKVRAMLGTGPWGTGAPEPTAKFAKHKRPVKKAVSRLCELLLIRRNSMEWGEYWQRDLCQHWSDVRGCLMHSSDCDSCTHFQRIRPQYCRLCGSEFLERQEQTFCPRCRTMRKKQAQRKYAVLHARGRL